MNLGQILNTSSAFSLLNRFYERYMRLEQKICHIYQDSRIYRLTNQFREKIKICFRYSFLGRVTEITQSSSRALAVLYNSQVVRYSVGFYNEWKGKIIRYLRTSLATELAKDTKEELKLSAVRSTSLIIVAAVAVNMFLALGLQKPIGIWGWLMRGLFLFVGLNGIFCNTDWLTLKNNSIILRLIRKSQK